MIRLLNAPTSPFGRKVTTALLELDMPFAEAFVDINVPSDLDKQNPLRQVPTLVGIEGFPIYGSTVIVEYLDSLIARPLLFDPQQRWAQLTRMSLADGLMEAVRMTFLDGKRADGERSPSFVERLNSRVDRSLHALSGLAASLGTNAKADNLAIACSLKYTEFRHGSEWRIAMPELANWLVRFCERPSMQQTEPTRTQAFSR
jgi:glutathione S-transferase